MEKEKQVFKKTINGKVVKVVDNRTIKMEVESKSAHPKYGKIIKSHKRYLVDTDGREVKVGDMVEAMECNPVSKNKSFKLVGIS